MLLLAPHTSGPRDVPRCGALSLLQKDAALQGGGPAETAARLNVKLRDLRDCVRGLFLPLIKAAARKFDSLNKNPVKDFCWWDLGGVCLSVVCCCRAVVDGSLDLSARETSSTSFFI